MKERKKTAVQWALIVLLVVEAAASAGLIPLSFGTPPVPEPASLAAKVWNGGPSLLFADDVSDATARLYDAMDPLQDGQPFGYYGGAIPTHKDDELRAWTADRWDLDRLRWGQEGAKDADGWADAQAWQRVPVGDGAWAFGDAAQYPSATLAGLVTPIVDLRDVPKAPAGQDQSTQRPSQGEVSGYVGDQIVYVETNELPSLIATATSTPALAPGSNPLEPVTPVAGGELDTSGARASESPSVLLSTAALRLRHAYGFLLGEDGSHLDGGRVEVSSFDAASGWSDWAGLAPTDRQLQLAGQDARASRDVPVLQGGSVGVSLQGGSAIVSISGPSGRSGAALPPDASVLGSQDPTGQSTPPWLYQGQVGPTGNNNDPRGAWDGFGGASGGLVDSVFDLTPYAGHLVRFRFLASSAGSRDGDLLPGLGWVLDDLEVDGAGAGGVSILGLAAPLEGGAVAPGASFHPAVVLQNRGLALTETTASLSLDSAAPETAKVRLGIGPAGRGIARLASSFTDLAGAGTAGVHLLGVTVTGREPGERSPGQDLLPLAVGPALDASHKAASATQAVDGAGSSASSASASFHFLVGGASEWRAVAVRTAIVGPDAPDDPSSHLLLRKQKLRIDVDFENTGPAPLPLPLASVAPVLRLTSGADVVDSAGAPTVMEPPSVGHLDLPVSRATSGLLGVPDPVRTASWTWDGVDVAEPVRLTVERHGATSAKLLDGGLFRVESSEPSPLDEDLGHDWDYTLEGTSITGKCVRHPAFAARNNDRRIGVLECPAGASAISPPTSVTALYERNGAGSNLSVVYSGAGTVVLQRDLDRDPGTPPQEGDQWASSDPIELPAVAQGAWGSATFRAADFRLPSGGPLAGWVRLTFSGADPVPGADPGPLLVDSFHLDVGPVGRAIPVVAATFNAVLQSEEDTLAASDGGLLARIGGTLVGGSDCSACEVDPGSLDGVHPAVHDGTLSVSGDFDTTFRSAVNTDDKARGDQVLQVPGGPFKLDGARPTLRFGSWMAARGGSGTVEVSDASPGVPDAARTWTPVATVRGLDGLDSLQHIDLPLWGYVKHTVDIRFRYTPPPEAQYPYAPASGWVLDAIQLDMVGADGLHVLRPPTVCVANACPDGVEGYAQSAGVSYAAGFVATARIPAQRTTATGFSSPGFLIQAKNSQPRELCPSPAAPNTYSFSPAIVTDPIDLRSMTNPILTIEQGGYFNHYYGKNVPNKSESIIDLEYRILGDHGWGVWRRATDHATWVKGSDHTWDGQMFQGGLKGLDGLAVTEPFALDTWGMTYDGHAQQYTHTPTDREVQFKLGADKGTGHESGGSLPAGHVAQFRLHAWDQSNGRKTGDCDAMPDSFGWMVYGMRIEERKPLVDAAVGAITLSRDDAPLLAKAGHPVEGDAAVVAGDIVKAQVAVTNSGILASTVDVALDLGLPADLAGAKSISFIDTSSGQDHRVDNVPHGVLHLQPGETKTAKFEVSFRHVPPGAYPLNAGVTVLDGADTKPVNDVTTRAIEVKPVRSLRPELTRSGVKPVAGTPDDSRLVRFQLFNDGNVNEQHVRVEAEVVRMTGLTQAASLDPPFILPGDLSRDLSLSAHGGGVGRDGIVWSLDPATGPPLVPGTRYAIRVTVQPQADSMAAWWDNGRPILPSEMVDASPPSKCGCFYLPFIVEGNLFKTDLTPEGSQSAVASFPDTGSPGDWSVAREVLDGGVFQDASSRSDLPGWSPLDHDQAVAAVGPTPGGAWDLPAYGGPEVVRNTLTSPVIPAHVVRPEARAIVTMRYASGLADGQAVLEQRVLKDGRWGDWTPVDSLRLHRVALVLAPDFPNVVSDAVDSQTGGGYGNNFPQAVVPPSVPPYYNTYSGTALPVGCGTSGHLCDWSQFPDFPAGGNPAWTAALAAALQKLAKTDGVGPDNVALFTTLAGNDQFALPLLNPADPSSAPSATNPVVWDKANRVILVYNPGQTGPLSFPLRELQDLGNHLGDYGSILLWGDGASSRLVLGDGVTSPYHSPSQALNALSSGGNVDKNTGLPALSGDLQGEVSTPVLAASRAPAVYQRHFDDLQEILRASAGAGVRVVGAIGPATGVLGYSGVADGAQLAAWVPRGLSEWGFGAIDPLKDVACVVAQTSPPVGMHPGLPPSASYTPGVLAQPAPPCVYREATGSGTHVDLSNLANYHYISAQDAQALALKDLLEARGAHAVFSEVRRLSADPGPCQVATPKNQLFFTGGALTQCVVPAPAPVVSVSQGSDLTFVTAASESQVGPWIDRVLGNAGSTGQLPAGSGAAQWQDLDPAFGSPVAGSFRRDASGGDAFVGEPTQFRLVVTSDAAKGQGRFLVGKLQILGTPSERDLGVSFVEPRDGGEVQPGSPFFPAIAVENRGAQPMPAATLQVTMAQPQGGDCGGTCTYPTSQMPPIRLSTPALAPGESRVLTIGGPALDAAAGVAAIPGRTYVACLKTVACTAGDPIAPYFQGFFPRGEGSSFTFGARLQQVAGPWVDGVLLDDAGQVSARGVSDVGHIVNDLARNVTLLPSEATRASAPVGAVQVRVVNDGSYRLLTVRVDVEVDAARPLACPYTTPGDSKVRGYIPCDPATGHAQTPPGQPVGQASASADVPQGASSLVQVPLDPDALGLPAGAYRVHVVATALGLDGNPVKSVEAPFGSDPILHLGDSSLPADGGFASQQAPVAAVADDAGLAAFSGGSVDLCQSSSGTGGLRHGWRVSDDATDPCGDPNGARPPMKTNLHAIEWRRDPAATTSKGAISHPLQATTPDQMGQGDFGPDTLRWLPAPTDGLLNGRGAGQVPASLAAYQDPALTVVSDFAATPLTAYAVRLEVASLDCTTPFNPAVNQGPTACSWTWDQDPGLMYLGDDSAGQGQTTTGPSGLRKVNSPCTQDMYNPAGWNCPRDATNALAGQPALWGLDSAFDPSGVATLHYPLRAPSGSPLETYCRSIAARDTGVGLAPVTNPPTPPPPDLRPGLEGCRTARVRLNVPGHNYDATLPRPVRFAFVADSFGGDAGSAAWRIRSISLGDHRLVLDSPPLFKVALNDGEERRLPVTVRNAGSAGDDVQVDVAPADESLALHDVRWAVVRHATDALPEDGAPATVVHLEPGQAATVWAVLRIGYQTGNDVGIQSLIPLVATAHSVRDPGQVLHAGIDAAFTALPRADLQVPSIFLSDSGHRASGGSEDFHGSVGVPIAITAEMVNHGLETAGGADQPIAVRLEVQQAPGGQPTGAPVLVRSVAQTAAMRGCTPACPPSQFLTLGEWTPPSEGLYRVRVVVNDPAAGEGAPIPENDFGNDASVRFVQVGAVPLPEVRVTQGWLIPLREGSCDLGAAPVQVAVAGHAYCSVAHVANQGGAPALNVRVDFRVGGALFSSRFPFAAGDGSFPSGSALDVVSSPWVARLRTDGGQDWTFGVEVSSASSSQTPLGKSVQFPVRVDQYRLALAQGTAPAVVLLAPGGEAVVEFNVTNVGTAVATPRVADSGVDVPVSVHVLQATPLLPPQDGRAGETGRVRIVLDAARAFNATDVVPPIHLTTQEDSLVSLALPLDVRAAGPLLARAATLPLTTLPGNVTAQVVLDNTATGLPTDWTLQGADWPLAADGQALGEVAPFATAVRAVALRVAEAPPGAYDVNLTLQARQGPAAQAFQVPIHLVVLPDLRMDASLPSSFIAGRAGQPVGLVVHVANPGNLPIEARVNATVPPGTVAAPGPAALAPGASADLALLVRQGGSSRSIGSAAVEWRTPGGPWRSGPAFPWQVDFAPAAIRIASSNLDGLSTKGGKVGEVQATLRNDADGPVQAELLVVVDGVLEGRATVSLEPGQSRPVTVAFQAGPAGVSQVVELVARPVGSTLGAGDPLLYQVGDAQARNLVPAQDGFLGIPAPAMALAALLLLALAGLARRKAA